MRGKSYKVRLIKEYYDLLGEKLFWNASKVHELCNHSQISLEELAALLRMNEANLKSKMIKGFTKSESLLIYQIAVNKGYYTPLP